VGSTYCLVVSGPMPSAAIAAVRDRFDDVRIRAASDVLLIECSVPDQAALRALLTSVWDVGGELALVTVLPAISPRSRHDHDQR
jgi:hypothetical protein